jgi:DNA-binding transcriptional LysR family regulator
MKSTTRPPRVPRPKPTAANATAKRAQSPVSLAHESRLKNLTLRQLRFFEAVASQLSYSRAAEQLHVTQPAVSMQVHQLESDLGLLLLVREGRKVSLSHAGLEMLRQTRRILNQVLLADETITALHRAESSSGGLLHLGVVPTAHYFAPRLLMAFARTRPDAKFKLTVDRRDVILGMLQERRLDIAIAGYPPSESDVEAESFARHPHCIVASADHPLVGERHVRWSALKGEPFIFREPDSATRKFFEHLLQAQALQVKVSMELSGNESIKQAVMAGMGISFLSAHTFQIELEARRMAVLDLVGMPKMLDWCLLHRRDSQLTGANESFRRFVLEHGAEITHCQFQ